MTAGGRCLNAAWPALRGRGSEPLLNTDFYVGIHAAVPALDLALVLPQWRCRAGAGVLLLVPRFQPAAAWGLVALLIRGFPANIICG